MHPTIVREVPIKDRCKERGIDQEEEAARFNGGENSGNKHEASIQWQKRGTCAIKKKKREGAITLYWGEQEETAFLQKSTK